MFSRMHIPGWIYPVESVQKYIWFFDWWCMFSLRCWWCHSLWGAKKPITHRVKGYTWFVKKYVTDRRKRFGPHKVFIFLIRITSRADLAMSVCPSVRMNAEIPESIRDRLLGFGMQIPELLSQRKFVLAGCHAHSNAHKPRLRTKKKIFYWYVLILSIPIDWPKKSFPRPL